MPRTPRSRTTAATSAQDVPVTTTGTTEVTPDASLPETEPKRRAPRRRRVATASEAAGAATQDDSTTPTTGEVLPNEPAPAVANDDTSTTQTTGQITNGAAGEPALTATPRRRGRPRTRRNDAPAEGQPLEEQVQDPAAPAASQATIAEPPASEVSTPSAPPAHSWSTGRPYEVGPDGRVRFLDTPAPSAPTASNLSAAVDEEQEPVDVTSDAAADDAGADMTTTPGEEPAEPSLLTRGRSGRGLRPEAVEVPAAATVGSVEEIVATSVVEESDAFAEEPAAIDEGLIQGETTPDAADAEIHRRRRRPRRGGRGRRRNGVSPDASLDVGEAISPDLAEAEGIALPEQPEPALAPEPAPAARQRPSGSGSALSPLEALMARQNVILDQLMQRQEKMARSMEQALLAVESRLKGTDLSRVSAMPRLAVFVDVPNIMYAAERYKVAVDFGKLLDYVSRDRTLIRASAYAPISDDPTQRLELQRFVEPFVNHGYRIVTKPLKRFADGSIKANFDVELAMDILTMSDRLDIVSLVSGDGDFRRLVDLVASKGVRVEVVAFQQSTAAELKAVADTYVDLTQHLKDLCIPVEGEIRPRVARPRSDLQMKDVV